VDINESRSKIAAFSVEHFSLEWVAGAFEDPGYNAILNYESAVKLKIWRDQTGVLYCCFHIKVLTKEYLYCQVLNRRDLSYHVRYLTFNNPRRLVTPFRFYHSIGFLNSIYANFLICICIKLQRGVYFIKLGTKLIIRDSTKKR